ncbi:HlyD family secretion protein [Lachnotalea glycerini]|uniref:HlyD family secretion protein n=1 Tax=Lachnotalea glycerini TaxID=1763509 RepID=A0A318ENY1_9FIRM|nr:HlyD family efflux transporter periplasmic adaptor subunit [Lachnotalea glycerini]PXV86726.1 HlyD family secretion protein [Lachnotalea glycerini]
MNETAKKRRDWVKNAAIIFLSIMLVLTFFSNTIMNYSLPEVATQAVTSGTITTKVRGSGTVSVSEPYNVTVKESRVIKSVDVKKGDVVEKGAILFELEDSDSTELKEAESTLSQLILDYQKAILNGDTSLSKVNQIEEGKITDMTTLQQKVENAKNAVKAAEDDVAARTSDVASIQKQVDLLNNETVDTSDEEAAVTKANKALTKAQAALSKAENTKTSTEEKVLEFGSSIGEVRTLYSSKETAYNDAVTAYDTAKKAFDAVTTTDSTYADLKAALDSATKAKDTAASEFEKVKASKSSIDSALSAYDKAAAAYESATTKVTDCTQAVTEAEAALTAKTSSTANKNELADLNGQLIEANDQLTRANATLTEAQSDQEDILKQVLEEVDLGGQNDKIKEQQEKVDKLKSEAIGATIEAPVAGTVTSLAKAAGESTTPDEALAVIQIADKGFSLSFSVSEQQAKSVAVGDVADIEDSWNYEDCKVTLASIKADSESKGKNKLLVFDVTGEISDGQQLNVTVGSKSANYDLIVPTSAIREDKNGKFILTVESKNSPLGNRYIATRVDVEILASDETQTAVSAGLYGYEYVITTSTKPVEAGKQVRLAD